MILTFEIFGRARNHGKKFLKLCQTSFSGVVHCYKLGFVDLELILVGCLDSKLQLGCLKCVKKRPGYQQQIEWKFGKRVFL